MNKNWSDIIHYTAVGWKRTTWPWLVFWVLTLAALAFLTPGPFWVLFSSFIPFLSLYFLLVGFLLEILDQDWKNWHLW